MRRAIGLDGRDPVVVRLLEPLLRPSPRTQPFAGVEQAVSRHVGTAGGGLQLWDLLWHRCLCSVAGKLSLTAGRLRTSIQNNLESLFGPLINPLQRLLQVLQRVGNAEAQISFTELAECCARERRHSCLLQ